MDENVLRYTLRVDRILFQKFKYIADSEGRSANKEIGQYIKKCVKEYEEEHGEIKIWTVFIFARSHAERAFLIIN